MMFMVLFLFSQCTVAVEEKATLQKESKEKEKIYLNSSNIYPYI